MNCASVKSQLSDYLDGAVSGGGMRAIGAHLERCGECRGGYERLAGTQKLVAGLGHKPAPAALEEQLRKAIAREAALRQQRRWRWEAMQVRWSNALNGFMLPATAGLVSAVLCFGLLIGYIVAPSNVEASASADDTPLMLYTPPQLSSSPFMATVGDMDGSLVVETYVDANGRVSDYRIISAPQGTQKLIPQLDNMMIFTTFRPAMTLGRPAPGRVVLSFSGINVRG